MSVVRLFQDMNYLLFQYLSQLARQNEIVDVEYEDLTDTRDESDSIQRPD